MALQCCASVHSGPVVHVHVASKALVSLLLHPHPNAAGYAHRTTILLIRHSTPKQTFGFRVNPKPLNTRRCDSGDWVYMSDFNNVDASKFVFKHCREKSDFLMTEHSSWRLVARSVQVKHESHGDYDYARCVPQPSDSVWDEATSDQRPRKPDVRTSSGTGKGQPAEVRVAAKGKGRAQPEVPTNMTSGIFWTSDAQPEQTSESKEEPDERTEPWEEPRQSATGSSTSGAQPEKSAADTWTSGAQVEKSSWTWRTNEEQSGTWWNWKKW